jgi:glycosyltransferase involved in cell wall biosynthesis
LKKLAIITTHPIQYYAPLFRLLAQRNNVHVKVFYTWGEQAKNKVFDPGFGAEREWDIPLLDGYGHEFVKNISTAPGSSHFKGIVNPGLIESIKTFGANAVLVFGWAFDSHLKVIRYFKDKIPVYFRGDSTLLDEPTGFSVKKMLRRIFLSWVYKHIDIAFYAGTNNKAYYNAHGVGDERLVYAPHAIDNDRFNDSKGSYTQQANEWKQKLNIPSDKLAVLFAGKLEPKKNPMFMVEAAKTVPQMHFIIIGNGVLEKEIKQAAANVTNITLLPFQNQSIMPVVYRLADIFVLPSQGPGETWGLAINEAMASGRAVIATNKCGGAIDLIEDGENGYIIEPNVTDFIKVLKSLLNKPAIIESGSEISLKHIQSFTFTHIAESIEKQISNQ